MDDWPCKNINSAAEEEKGIGLGIADSWGGAERTRRDDKKVGRGRADRACRGGASPSVLHSYRDAASRRCQAVQTSEGRGVASTDLLHPTDGTMTKTRLLTLAAPAIVVPL